MSFDNNLYLHLTVDNFMYCRIASSNKRLNEICLLFFPFLFSASVFHISCLIFKNFVVGKRILVENTYSEPGNSILPEQLYKTFVDLNSQHALALR